MPKSFNCEGLIALPDAGPAVLKHCVVENHPAARARVRQRLVRAALERRPELAVRIGPRLYFRDEPPVLDTLVAKLGLLQPPVTAEPAHAKRASSPSSIAATA